MSSKDNLENIDKARKALEAKKDKEEIYNVRYSPSKNFDAESNRVYNKFSKNVDYLKHLEILKLKNNNVGTTQFKDLNNDEKKYVLGLMIQAIENNIVELKFNDNEML